MGRGKETREPQYRILFDVLSKFGATRLGLMANESWNQDPKRTVFILARYKRVAKMLAGKHSVLEIGCGDALGTRLVQQEVDSVTAVDFDQVFIDDVRERMSPYWPIECFKHDLLERPVPGTFEAAYCLDVPEHIRPEDEDLFLKNACSSLTRDGVMIVGMPSLESQDHASPQSKEGHVNCKTGKDLKQTMQRYFSNVFVFSMNDEVVHTGYYPMAHYLLALCCGLRDLG